MRLNKFDLIFNFPQNVLQIKDIEYKECKNADIMLMKLFKQF